MVYATLTAADDVILARLRSDAAERSLPAGSGLLALIGSTY
jgi:hypothetical protein